MISEVRWKAFKFPQTLHEIARRFEFTQYAWIVFRTII